MKKKVLQVSVSSPALKLHMLSYVHRVLTYRYHWHDDEYEIDIILKGRAVFSRGGDSVFLDEGDAVIVEPLTGHASLALDNDTLAIVIRFSACALQELMGCRELLSFSPDHSDSNNRSEARFMRLRALAADLLLSASGHEAVSSLESRDSAELLTACLVRCFNPVASRKSLPKDSIDAKAVADYLEKNYMHRISLSDLADFSGYNRTYLSTFFKDHTGLNFHDFLTWVRFKHAMEDLTYTEKSVLSVAIDSGFPDAKSFSSFFSQAFHMTPMQYRQQVRGQEKSENLSVRILRNINEDEIRVRLLDYSQYRL